MVLGPLVIGSSEITLNQFKTRRADQYQDLPDKAKFFAREGRKARGLGRQDGRAAEG